MSNYEEDISDDDEEIFTGIEEDTLNDDVLHFQKNYESDKKNNISR